MKETFIALEPTWTATNFAQRVHQISQQLREDKIQAVGLWFEDAALFACALLSCFQSNVKVLLPPNMLIENQTWIKKNADILLNDETILNYGISKSATITHLKLSDFDNTTPVWMKTSGSSGEAKVLAKTANQLWKEAIEVGKFLPFQDEYTHIVGSVSVQHFYGLTYRVLIPLWHHFQGRKWTLGREQLVYPEYMISESRHAQKSLWISSPALLTRLNLANPNLATCNLIGIISSGGALDEDLGISIQQAANCLVLEGYGSTETGCIAFRQPKQPWKPLQDVKIGTNEEGALWVESSRTVGREQTADAVELVDNAFHLLGRIDRIVKLGDKRVSMITIEQDLQRHQWVADSFVAQHPDKQRAVAWLALNATGIEFLRENGRKALIEILKTHLSNTQEKFALPRYWRLTERLPRNAQSKILRSDFEQICQNDILTPAWSIENIAENSLVLRGKVPLDLHHLKGHFVNFPLVPGVVELQWAIDQIPQLLKQNFDIERIDALKFQQFVRPNDELTLTLTWDEQKSRIKFQIESSLGSCASGLLIGKICNAIS